MCEVFQQGDPVQCLGRVADEAVAVRPWGASKRSPVRCNGMGSLQEASHDGLNRQEPDQERVHRRECLLPLQVLLTPSSG